MAMGLASAQPKVVSGYENGKPGGTLTMALSSAPQTMFYYGAIDSAIQTLANQMFDGLIEYNYKTYQIEPALAASWTITGESKVYTFKLRKGVKWSDGRDLTADDVVFTYTRSWLTRRPKAAMLETSPA